MTRAHTKKNTYAPQHTYAATMIIAENAQHRLQLDRV